MSESPSNSKPDTRRNRDPWPAIFWTIRSNDQAVIAGVITVSLVFIIGSWFYRGGHRGHLIDVDRADPELVEFQLNINEADWPELSVLPEIGETLAKRIVETRTTGGPFSGIDDLRRVRGIGPRTLERIRPYLQPIPDFENTADRTTTEQGKS